MNEPFSELPSPGTPPSAEANGDPWRRTLELLISMGRDLERQDAKRAIDCYRQASDLAHTLDQVFDEGRALVLLGSLELDRGDLGAAEQALTRALELLNSTASREQATSTKELAACLNNLGRLCFKQGRLDDALRHLRASLTRTTELELTPENCGLRGDTLHLLGTVYREKGETDQALRYLHDGLELHRAEGNENRIAQEMNSIGALLIRLGRYTEAAEQFEGALERWRRLGHRPHAASAANNLAAVNIHLGRLSEARALLEESGRIFVDLGESAHAANVHTNLGLLASSQGRMDDSEEQLQEALRLHRALNDRAGEATALNNLSMVAIHRGRPEEAIGLGTASLELRTVAGFERGQAKPLHNIAQALLELGRVDEARSKALLALEKAKRTGAEEQRVEIVTLLAQCHVAGGQLDAALADLPGALETAEKTEDPKLIILACHTLGVVHVARGELEEAKLFFARANRLMRGWEHPYEKASVLHDEGRMLLLAGSVDAGMDRLRRAEEEFARLGNARKRLRVLGELAAAVADRDPRQKISLERVALEIAVAHGLESYWQDLVSPTPASDASLTRSVVGARSLRVLAEELQQLINTALEGGSSPALGVGEIEGPIFRSIHLATEALLRLGDVDDVRFVADPEWALRWSESGHLMQPLGARPSDETAWSRAQVSGGSGAVGVLWWRPLSGSDGSVLEDRGRLVASVLGLALSAFHAGVPSRAGTDLPGSRAENFEGLVGASAPLRAVSRMIEQVAPTESTALILGESGTGKELVARAIHTRSPRKDGPFVAINCPSIPRDLIESELFGHERGAFTGAVATRPGKVESADGGTLFLDEIGDMSLSAQVKLLRFLQEREFERVGGRRTLRANVRVIAATSRDLLRMIEAETFREDLYYRLHVVPVRVPSLRERLEDVPILVEHFLNQLPARAGQRRRTITRGALDALRAHRWPGNVRELQNVIEYMTTVAGKADLDVSHLPSDLRQRAPRRETPGAVGLSDSSVFELRPGETLDARLIQLEAALIRTALLGANWNQSAAARRLGITESMIRNRMRHYSIEKPGE